MQSETLGWRKLREIVDYTIMHLPYKRRYQMSRLDKDVKPKIEHCDSESESCAKDVKPKIEHCDSESESCAKDL